MKILNIAKAKEDIVSCYGSDCNLCSLLETISNIYNLLLGIVFALGVLYLIIVGLRVFLESGRTKALKNLKDGLKYILTGFGLILLGWLTIHTVFWASGYTNAGSWWNFKCSTSGDSLASNDLIDSSDSLTSYTTLAGFLNSGDTIGKIEGPDYSFAFAQQLDSLDENQSIQFYAPATSRGGGITPQLVFTVKKEGGEIGLENTGEFWKVVQSEWVNVQKTSSFKDKGILNRVLKADTSDYILPDDKETLTPLYSSIADVALEYEQTETAKNQPTIDLNNLLLITILYLFDKNKSSDEGNLIMALLLTEILKIFDSLIVETNIPQVSNVQKNCINSGGEWVDKCVCNDESVLKNNGKCYLTEALKLKCLESKGSWEELTSNSQITPICSKDKVTDQEIPDPQYFCNCLENSCITYEGECISKNKDTDGDGINDDKDKCINTPEGEKVNQKEGSDNYGCSCSEIEIPQKNCPQDYCEGDYLYIFPRGKQECLNGELQAYTCETKKEYNQECADKEDEEEIDEIRDDVGDGSGNNNSGDNSPNPGENSSGNGENSEPLGNPEGVKAALKRIEQRDPLRYEMVFRFVSFIKPTGFSGGYCTGCGNIWANHGSPLKVLDQIIIHEATHSAHACTTGWGIGLGSVEWIAVANQIGSLYGRDKGPEDMTEFQGQSKQVSYRGTEVRGYLARYLKKVNPKGDMGPGNMDHWLQYAFSYIPKRTWGNTKGPYHYGDFNKDPKIRLLGLVQKEEDVIDTIMETIQECRKDENKGKGKCKCKSSPPPDLPPVGACKGAPVIQFK